MQEPDLLKPGSRISCTCSLARKSSNTPMKWGARQDDWITSVLLKIVSVLVRQSFPAASVVALERSSEAQL